MNVDRFGGWLALAANLGVVAGLIMLAVELRQNTQVVRAQAVSSLLTGVIAGEIAFMGDDTAAAYTKAEHSPEALTSEEIGKVWAYLNVTMLSVQQTHTMYKLGLASDEAWGTAKDWAIAATNFRFGRVWWREVKGIYPSDLVEEVDAILAEADPHTAQGADERIINELRKPAAN